MDIYSLVDHIIYCGFYRKYIVRIIVFILLSITREDEGEGGGYYKDN